MLTVLCCSVFHTYARHSNDKNITILTFLHHRVNTCIFIVIVHLIRYRLQSACDANKIYALQSYSQNLIHSINQLINDNHTIDSVTLYQIETCLLRLVQFLL